MFKQLSQIGNNLKEELAKSLQDDNMNDANGGTLPEEYLQYPKEVQFKLRKLNKYENKYPLLLQAYKNEKNKNAQSEQIFTVLSEHTPIQSFDLSITPPSSTSPLGSETGNEETEEVNQETNPVAQLKQFFQNMQMKTDLLNEEIKRLTVDLNQTKKENQELKERETQFGVTELVEKNTKKGAHEDGKKETSVVTETSNAETDQLTQDKDTDEKANENGDSSFKIEKPDEGVAKTFAGNASTKTGENEEETASIEEKNKTLPTDVDEKTASVENRIDTDLQPAPAREDFQKSSEALPNSKESSPTSNEKKPKSAIQWEIKYNSLKNDYDSLNTKYETLKTNHDKSVKNLKTRTEELDNVRDMLKEVGNQLVEIKDKTKESDKLGKRVQELENRLKLETNSKKTIMNTMQTQKDDFSKKLENFNNTYKQEVQSKKEFERKFMEKDRALKYLEEQVKETNKKLSQSELDLKQLNLKHERFVKSNENAVVERDQYKKQIDGLNKAIEDKIKENGKLSERLDILQEKFDNNKNIEENSSDFVENMKRQCNELNIKLRESIRLKNSLEEELNDTMSTLQEKNKELAKMKRSINEQDMQVSNQIEDWKNKYQISVERAKSMENELNLLILTQKDELTNSKTYNDELNKKIAKLEENEQLLKKQVAHLNTSFSVTEQQSQRTSSASEVLNSTIQNLKSELTKAVKLSREYEQSNTEMKKLNQELNLKLERLSKNYKSLSAQLKSARTQDYDLAKPSPRRHSSITSLSSINDVNNSLSNFSTPSTPSETKTSSEQDYDSKLSYIKNVLIGFMEHKDQRQQLLPVVSMLFKFTNQEEQKFLTSLK
ncbi:hypothetical protein ACO0RG_004097 [Hanseniaspora osmophila]|uniref:Golgin IMH1 n=1 Tax=Hanseniaspora osmophila TaxID=56408 RepID=A0A1E5RAU8_9ASCO|nr:Golgin IMH1 [Hanseniaspora osmophila]